jgi:serine/threonine protein kinase
VTRKIGSRYTVTKVIGRGTSGTVWEGTGPYGPVAVKLLRDDLAADQTLIARFVQERTVLMSLTHPNVVAVRDLVVDGTDLALVMDLVRGSDLRARLDARRALRPAEAAAVAADIAAGLAAAHARGVVHRDVKPENVLLDAETGVARLTDFGIARLVDGPRRTRATRIVGTPDYLAPEVIEGCPPGPPVDVYALGTVLFELLTGWTPFGGGHPGAVLRRHVTETAPDIPGMPEALAELLDSCLSKAPAARLSAAEVTSRLRVLGPALGGLPALRVADPRAVVDPAPRANGPGPAIAMTVGSVPLIKASGDGADDSRQTHPNLIRPIREPLGPSAPVPGGETHTARGRSENLGTAPSPTDRRGGRIPAIAAVLAALTLATGGYIWWNGHQDARAAPHPVAATESDVAGKPFTATSTGAASQPIGPLGLYPLSRLPAPPAKPIGALHYAVAADNAYLVMTGADGAVRYASAKTRGRPEYSQWQPVAGLAAATEPTVIGRASGAVEIYVTGSDGQVHRTVFTGGGWSPWSTLAAAGTGTARVVGAPAAVAVGTDRTEVLVASETGSLLATSGIGAVGGAWQQWRAVPAAGSIKPEVALAERADGAMAAYVIRASDLAVLRVVNDGHWEYGWPTGAVGRPEAAYIRAGKPYLFIRAVSGDVQVFEPSGANLKGSMTWVPAGVTSQNPVGVAEDPDHGLVLAVTAADGSVQLYTWGV